MIALAAATRSWPMLAALGAGLVLLALGAGAGEALQPALVVLGVAALGWAVLALRAGRAIAPVVVLAVSAAFLVGAGALVGSGTAADADVAAGPLAATSAFVVVVAVACGLALRRRRDPRWAARPEGSSTAGFDRRTLVGLVVGAALVSALATPALAGTEPGDHAVPHGSHEVDEGHPAGEHGTDGHLH